MKRELISAQLAHKHNNKDELPRVTLTWHASKCEAHKFHQRHIQQRRGHPVLNYMSKLSFPFFSVLGIGN